MSMDIQIVTVVAGWFWCAKRKRVLEDDADDCWRCWMGQCPGPHRTVMRTSNEPAWVAKTSAADRPLDGGGAA